MKVAIYGAGGILGQHLRLVVPLGVKARCYRRQADLLHCGIDLTSSSPDSYWPDVIVNFAGEARPDVVEKDPSKYHEINVLVPDRLARWCDAHWKHYIHISTQGVFGGQNAPYGPESELDPINEYGKQKAQAEELVKTHRNWTILRPTFVLGVRPLPHVGRQNPMEQMLENPESKQVDDRWFSPLFAREAARAIWEVVAAKPKGKTIHLGTPIRVTRHYVSLMAGGKPKPVSHNSFPGLAPRPKDTHYSMDTIAEVGLGTGITQCKADRESELLVKAREISLFLGISEREAVAKLVKGFIPLHQEVAADFNRARPQNDAELLGWYRQTESYIWELSAYHMDEGFNYSGMCQDVIDRLRNDKEGQRVLCLGDGIGGLTLALRRAGIDAVYHDLRGSRTAAFAEFRFWMHRGCVGESVLTEGWRPRFDCTKYETIICFDFLEHVTDVPAWMKAIKELLHPGGVALFQNAFGIGSQPGPGADRGSIPMHLKRNDRYEKEWTPLMATLGFKQQGTSNWWEVAA